MGLAMASGWIEDVSSSRVVRLKITLRADETYGVITCLDKAEIWLYVAHYDHHILARPQQDYAREKQRDPNRWGNKHKAGTKTTQTACETNTTELQTDRNNPSSLIQYTLIQLGHLQ